MWLGLALVDWLIVIAFLIGLIAVGVYLASRVKNETDYFMGGRRYGKVLMIFFSFASATSSDEAVQVTAGTWRAGLTGIWWAYLFLWATPFYWILAPILRRMRALTTSDFFEARYDRSTSTLYSVYGILILIAALAAELYGSGKLLSALTGGELTRMADTAAIHVPVVQWNVELSRPALGTRQLEGHEIAILVITLVFVSYGIAGGLAADIVTDFIQGILTVVFSFMLLPWIYHKIGGLDALRTHEHLKPGMLDLFGHPEAAAIFGTEPLTIFYVFMLALTGLVGVVVQPQIMSLCGAGKSEMEARWGFTYGHLMKRFCTIAWTFIGLACVVWYLSPQLSPLDRAERERLTPDHLAVTDAAAKPDAEGPGAEAPPAKVPYDPKFDRAFSDELFGKVAHDILPTGMLGLMLVGALAATMSSAATRMHAAGALFSEGLYKRFVAPGRTHHHYVWAGRAASLIAVLLAIVLQTTFTDVIDALKIVVKIIAPIGISFWIGIVWRGWTPLAVWCSSLTSYTVWAVCAYFPHALAAVGFGAPVLRMVDGHQKVADSWTMLFYLSLGLIAGLIVSRFSPRTPREKLDQFFLVLRTPVRPGETVRVPCTMPDDPLPPVARMFQHPDIEIHRPSRVGVIGFVAASVLVAILAWVPYWLARTL